MTRKILFPTDGSDSSRETLDWILQHQDPQTTEILVLSVADDAQFEHLTESLSYDESDEIRKHIQPRAQDLTTEVADELKNAGFSVETLVKLGDPGKLICETIRNEEIDELIMGRQGKGQIREILLGSVSHYVLHHSDVPVTIIPKKRED